MSTHRLGETDTKLVLTRFPELSATGENVGDKCKENMYSSLFPKCLQATSAKAELKEIAYGLSCLLTQGEINRVNLLNNLVVVTMYPIFPNF